MSVGWMKKGKESQNLAKIEEAEAEKRREEQGKLWRFFLKEDEDARITFVDGELSEEGYLLPPRFYEHQIYHNGTWNNFHVCPEKTNPESGDKCPLCESGDRPSLVALFTIIDHRVFKSKKGETYQDTPKLLVAKPSSFEYLNKIAIKRGGLAGCTFDVSRIGDKSASIGSMYDFVEKTPVEELRKKYVKKVSTPEGDKMASFFVPANYEEEIVYRTGDELRKLGFGAPSQSGGYTSGYNPSTSSSSDEYDDHL